MRHGTTRDTSADEEFPALSRTGFSPAFRELLYGLLINVLVLAFASLILDGGWIAAHYRPFAVAHALICFLLWLRAQRRDSGLTRVDIAVIRLGPLVGLVAAVTVALARN